MLIAGAAILTASALGLGGAALANAGSTAMSTNEAPAAGGYGGYAGGSGSGDKGRRGGIGQGEGLSGEAAVKAVQGAVAQEPTAILLRATKADDGRYRVALRRTDGTHIVLTLNADFAVTGTEERAAKAKAPRQRTSTSTSTASPST